MPKFPDGLYDTLITREIELAIAGDPRQIDRQALDPSDAHVAFARHFAAVMKQVLESVPAEERPERQAAICNEILRSLGRDDASVAEPPRRLASILPMDSLRPRPRDPDIPLSQNDLLINAPGEPRIVHVLEKEIDSADRIDLIVAFIRWSGLRLIEGRLRSLVERGGSIRVITTTYTGSTERLALERLVALGAEVRISYRTDSTRLHAKAWMFHRESGFSTAFIGSSNLSTSAMLDGLEWNVRLSKVDAPTIVEKFEATFEGYWADPTFEHYDPTRDAERFDKAISRATAIESEISFAGLEVTAWPHQREMLEALDVERYRHNRWRNLVVAATGTGKTVVAALDYRRLCEQLASSAQPGTAGLRNLSLLFVAHRKEILRQSLATFRAVMRDAAFGEEYVDGHRPEEWRHVFASVQSLQQMDPARISKNEFDVIVVDEFHHAAAPTYRKLLDHFEPRVLLGLTATPERTDGQPILDWFGGRIAVELRLWDALERELLSPFHYFGLHDSVDLSRVTWKRGAYEERELDALYTGNDVRVAQVLEQLRLKVGNVRGMRALGFCVGVNHARYMADRFNRAGIPSDAVFGTTDREERDRALRKLRDGEINCLFAVDLFNEGLDVPKVDTVLFLRPTESALIFLQQLGRGLRRADGKSCLTVLDFIGNAHRNFRFDLRFRAITGATRAEVRREVENGFPTLPAGCAIQLDREASRVVLDNLKESIGSRFATLVSELRTFPHDTSLATFLDGAALDLEDIYGRAGSKWGWTRLKREAFPLNVGQPRIESLSDVDQRDEGSLSSVDRIADAGPRINEAQLLTAIPRLLHVDDAERLDVIRRVLAERALPTTKRQRRTAEGFFMTLAPDAGDAASVVQSLDASPSARQEILEVLRILDDRAAHLTFPLEIAGHEDVPLSVHARYTRDEVLAAIGRASLAEPFSHREGPLWYEPTRTDYFFITLDKSERHYSPSTRYRDYAISPELFHWESQSTTPETSKVGQRYIHHAEHGTNVMLFVRPANKDSWGRTYPFTFLGPATYRSHQGSRPIAIVWELQRPMPLDVFKLARAAAG